tara:strand:+ start:519 stop:899 length:381 start_codon:yes stop_codon:yes gene_type:complete
MLDKVFLSIFGIEWLGFGVLGLFFPEIISDMIGVSQTSDFFLSETRAWYSFFTILGLMSIISVKRIRLQKKVYLTFVILMGSFLIGRTLSFFLDNSFGTGTAIAYANELIVFLIAYWRYTKRDFIF